MARSVTADFRPRLVDGSVGVREGGDKYGLFRLEPEASHWGTRAAQGAVVSAVAAALRQFLPENRWGLWLIQEPIDPGVLVSGSFENISEDKGVSAEAAEIEGYLSVLHEERGLARDALFVMLGLGEASNFVMRLWETVKAQIVETVTDTVVVSMGDREVAVAIEQARRIIAGLGVHVRCVPVGSGFHQWFFARMRRRGLPQIAYSAEMEPRRSIDPRTGLPHARSWTVSTLGEYVMNDPEDRRKVPGLADYNVLRMHRPVVVEEEIDGEVSQRLDVETERSYQVCLMMEDGPDGWEYPGGSPVRLLRELDFAFDLYVGGVVESNRTAEAKTRKWRQRIGGQIEEFKNHPAGVTSRVMHTAVTLEEYEAALGADPGAPELACCWILAFGAPTPELLAERMAQVTAVTSRSYQKWQEQVGFQEKLYGAMLPGGEVPPEVNRRLIRRLLPSGIARIGMGEMRGASDPYGYLLGFTRNAGPLIPSLLSLRYGLDASEGARGGSMMITGVQGVGKSYAGMFIASREMRIGSRGFVWDPTGEGDWCRAAQVWPGMPNDPYQWPCEPSTQVVNPFVGDVSVDPLRIFTLGLPQDQRGVAEARRDAEQVALGYLALKCGVRGGAGSDAYLLLSRVVQDVLRGPEAGWRMKTVLDRLRDESVARRDEQVLSQQLADRIVTMSEQGGSGKFLFGDQAPLNLWSQGLVLWTPGLRLPPKDSSAELTPEQEDARATAYLIMALGKKFVLGMPSFAFAVFDELSVLTRTQQGGELLQDMLRQIRRAIAALLFLSQLETDISTSDLDELIPRRLFGRGGSEEGVRAAMIRSGLEPSPARIDIVMSQGLGKDRKGQFIYRSGSGIWTPLQMVPAHPTEHMAFRSDSGSVGRKDAITLEKSRRQAAFATAS